MRRAHEALGGGDFLDLVLAEALLDTDDLRDAVGGPRVLAHALRADADAHEAAGHRLLEEGLRATREAAREGRSPPRRRANARRRQDL